MWSFSILEKSGNNFLCSVNMKKENNFPDLIV